MTYRILSVDQDGRNPSLVMTVRAPTPEAAVQFAYSSRDPNPVGCHLFHFVAEEVK